MIYLKTDNIMCIKRCGRYSQESGWDHPGKRINSHLLVLLERGECTFSVDGSEYALAEGDVIIVPKGCFYSPSTLGGCTYQYFQFTAERLDGDEGDMLYRSGTMSHQYGETLPSGGAVLALAEKHRADYATVQALSDAIAEMLADSAESKIRMNISFLSALIKISEQGRIVSHSLADKIKDYINSHKNESIALSDIAVALGYTKQHIIRVFKEKFGISPSVYAERQRLIYSASLLSGSSNSVAEVARLSGYDDPNYFTRRFTRHFGTSPLKYRAHSRAHLFGD